MPKGIKLKLNVCHMYPDLLNLYGDRGNIMAFSRRCQWRNIDVELFQVNIGDKVSYSQMDFVFLGGGSDREQNLMAADLMQRSGQLQKAIEDGLVVLAICGGYQLLGKYYKTLTGEVIPGLGILDLHTEGGQTRLIGNVALEVDLGGIRKMVTGFENHSGRTRLGNLEPLGRVLAGHGNNGDDKMEGARYKNVICTYLHGPFLPKNPFVTDYLISSALKRKYGEARLEPLDDSLENSANQVMLNRLIGSGR
ncbi:MAG: type 1 glutamine amidotransferase [Bacillota bacterium]